MEEKMEKNEEPKWNGWKIAALVGTGVSVLAANAFYGLSNYMIWKAMHPPKIMLKKKPSDHGLCYENVEFKSVDGLKLKGWWLPVDKGNKVIILSHAYGFNRYNMPFPIFDLVKVLQKQGYSVLVYDFRNSGESEGNETTIALKEQMDILGAIEFVKKEKEMKRVVLMGWSMGASASLLAGCISDDVEAIIADSPFSSLDTYVLDSFEYWTKLPRFIGKLSAFITKLNFLGFEPHKVKPIDLVREVKNKKIYIIHAKDDPAISCRESEKMKEACSDIVLWQPEKGNHIEAYRECKEEYEDKLIYFLKSL